MKVNVLEIIGDSSLAGAPRHLLGIIENLDLAKFKIHVICPPGPLANEIKSLKRQIDIDCIRMNSRSDLKAIMRIRKATKSAKADIIHVHGTRAGVLARLAAIGLDKPIIYTEHLWTKQFRLASPILNGLHSIGYWFLDLFTTTTVAVSGAVQDFLIANGVTREEKIQVIYNGITATKLEADTFNRADEDFRIVTIGTLNHNKGIQYLIKALPKVVKEFPNIKLDIVGDGPYKKELVAEIKRSKLEKVVKFDGFVEDIREHLTKFDVYIQPSLSESFGLAIVEAMSVGLPVIATNTGGIPEVVVEGKTGLLVEPANPEALSEAILKILRDPEKSKIMGETGRKLAADKFDIEKMVKKLERLYEETIQSPPFSE